MQLKQQAIRGAKWVGTSRFVSAFLKFITTAVLARLLVPGDFGLMSMMLVVIGLAQTVADAGISNAIIYRQDSTEDQLSSLYWLNLLSGMILFLALLLLRPLVVAYFKEPRISQYIPVLGIKFIVDSFGQQFKVLLRKELKFNILSTIDIVAVVITTILTILFAWLGFGVWSLVLQSILLSFLTSLAAFIWAVRSGNLPQVHFRFKDLDGYFQFGLFQMGERFLNFFGANIDYLIIGRFLGADLLGFYSLSYQLIKFPITQLNPIINQVAFPAFSKLEEDQVVRSWYKKIVKTLSTLIFPMLFGMVVVAPEFIEIVYGPEWLPAVPVIRILCFVGALLAQGNPIGSLLLSRGRADLGFYWNVFGLVFTAAFNYLGVRWGIEGVALSSLLVIALIRFPGSFYLRWLVIRMRVMPYLKSLFTPTLGATLMLALLVAIKPVWTGFSLLMGLSLQIITGAIIYLAVIYVIDRKVITDIRQILRFR